MTNPDRTSNVESSKVADTSGQHGDSSFCLPLLDGTPGTATVYRFSNVDHELSQYLPWTFNRGGSFDVGGDVDRGAFKLPTLQLAVLDKEKRELQVELVEGRRSLTVQRTALDLQHPWLLYCPLSANASGPALLRQRTFSVVMNVEDEALRQADSIRVSLVK